MGPMFGYVLVSILLPFVNLKGSSIGLILGQTINIVLSVGSAIVADEYPGLELKVMFQLTLYNVYFHLAVFLFFYIQN